MAMNMVDNDHIKPAPTGFERMCKLTEDELYSKAIQKMLGDIRSGRDNLSKYILKRHF